MKLPMHSTLKYVAYASTSMPESLETVNSGRFGNRSAIILENNSLMTSQLCLNIGIFRTNDHIFELKT